MRMRSAWRGLKRTSSAPKREMSYIELTTPMNSMAQQAVPKGNGHRLLRRPQLTTGSTRLVMKPSPRLISGVTAAGTGLKVMVCVLEVMVPDGGRSAVPVQRPLLVQVQVADLEQDQEDHQQAHHLPATVLEADRPRIEE